MRFAAHLGGLRRNSLGKSLGISLDIGHPRPLTDDGILQIRAAEEHRMADLPRLEYLEGRVEEQTRNWERLSGQIDGLDRKFDGLDQKVDGFRGELSARIDNLDSRLSGRMDSLEVNLSGRIGGLDTRIDNLDSRVSGRMDSLEVNLSGRIGGLDAKVEGFRNEFSTRFDMLDAKIDRKVDRLDGKVDGLRNELWGAIKTVEESVTDLRTKMDAFPGFVDKRLNRQFKWLVGIQFGVMVVIIGVVLSR